MVQQLPLAFWLSESPIENGSQHRVCPSTSSEQQVNRSPVFEPHAVCVCYSSKLTPKGLIRNSHFPYTNEENQLPKLHSQQIASTRPACPLPTLCSRGPSPLVGLRPCRPAMAPQNSAKTSIPILLPLISNGFRKCHLKANRFLCSALFRI